MEGLFDLKASQVAYEPFPVGYVESIFDLGRFEKLAGSFPELSQMVHFQRAGNKHLLSESRGTNAFFSHVRSHPEWARVYEEVKSSRFVQSVLGLFESINIDLGLSSLPVVSGPADFSSLYGRFEFGCLGPGGFHLPHTDLPKKVISIVISMTPVKIWPNEDIGGTSVCWPKDVSKSFNFMNNYMDFEDVSILNRYPFRENSGVFFPKTFNSWHCVEPIPYDVNTLRKTIVIQIIRNDHQV